MDALSGDIKRTALNAHITILSKSYLKMKCFGKPIIVFFKDELTTDTVKKHNKIFSPNSCLNSLSEYDYSLLLN